MKHLTVINSDLTVSNNCKSGEAAIPHKGFTQTEETDWHKSLLFKSMSTMVCAVYQSSHMSDGIMDVVLEEKVFAEFKANEA